MKIRTGFVSNSSSSSYIILLPDNVKIDLSRADYLEDITEDDVKDAIATLKAGESIWETENYTLFNVLTDVLGEYIIGTIEGGPDSGQISNADIKKVKELIR